MLTQGVGKGRLTQGVVVGEQNVTDGDARSTEEVRRVVGTRSRSLERSERVGR